MNEAKHLLTQQSATIYRKTQKHNRKAEVAFLIYPTTRSWCSSSDKTLYENLLPQTDFLCFFFLFSIFFGFSF